MKQKPIKINYEFFKEIFDIKKPFHKYSHDSNKKQNFLELTSYNQKYLEMKGQASENLVANFVQKAYQIINSNEHSRIIHWLSNGREFAIKDIDQFQDTILPNYFRHRNINSFIRQLNMYGFHKSRKEPTKNIFSHPFFQKDKPDLLIKIKRKIKNEEEITPKKYIPLDENSENKIVHIEEKPTALKENKPLNSSTSLAFRSSLCLENENDSPVKGFISRSLIMDFNPEICLKHRDSVMEGEISNEVEDDDEHQLSIADEIEREQSRFNNRVTGGISIVKTSNFLQDFEL